METEAKEKVPQSLMTPRMTFLDAMMIFLSGICIGALFTTFIFLLFRGLHHAG